MRREALSLFAVAFTSIAAADDSAIEEIVVTSKRQPEAVVDHIGNIAKLGGQAVRQSQHVHSHELLVRVPGVWVTRASGQESLPSIRSPVLTGPGSCGAFLVLENGIPTRPNGFCNVNQLFELPTELAAGVEVIRGPGNALYGSNALHGTINVLLPGADAPAHAALEAGPHDFLRVSGQLASAYRGTSAGVVHADDGGFRDDSGYRQTKGYVSQSLDLAQGSLTFSLVGSDLDQQTAGFILGFDAYKDPATREQNLNPEAYRIARSQRLAAHWRRPGERFDLDIRPFLRHSDMQFLQHFLPGKPLEENGQKSAGVLASMSHDAGRFAAVWGLDLEWADVYLRQTQFGETEGSDFLRETRPEGKHYDYRVKSFGAAAFIQTEYRLSDRLTLSAGLRGERVRYDYDNRMLDGNTRDDGTTCGFGGCLYTRPADRHDTFSNLAPKLGALFRLDDDSVAYVNAARGFRAPQMTELYRLQSGQLVSDLDPESVDSLEVGLRAARASWDIDASLFLMRKEDSVYRDANGFNISGGRSRHRGVEFAWRWQLHPLWRLAADGTYAIHEYDFDAVAARGETFASGNAVDSAPRWFGSAELQYESRGRIAAALQWVATGRYFLDAENQHTYPGHGVLNLITRIRLSDELSINLRLNNVADRYVADRADFAFGDYRYFPGRGRELFVQLRYAEAPD